MLSKFKGVLDSIYKTYWSALTNLVFHDVTSGIGIGIGIVWGGSIRCRHSIISTLEVDLGSKPEYEVAKSYLIFSIYRG